MSDSVERVAAELRDLIGKYWYVAYQEGVEGRTEDTSEGIAQSILREIEKRIDMLRLARTQAPRGMDRDNTALQLRYGIDYIDGWNDCREAMLAASPAAPEAKVLDVGFSIDYDSGTYTPTVLVGFKPNDWESRALDALRHRFDERLASLQAADAGVRLRSLPKPSSEVRGAGCGKCRGEGIYKLLIQFANTCEAVPGYTSRTARRVKHTQQAATAEVLNYLMQQFDCESWECPHCGWSEDCATMDSAHYLREYLAKQPQPDSRGERNTNRGRES